ncbi:helix-turn-helix domain-containing protein [Microbacterium tumbae]
MTTTLHTMAEAGAALRAVRLRRGLTQAAVARRAAVSREWLNEVENGKSRFDFGLYLAACGALDIDVVLQARDERSDA